MIGGLMGLLASGGTGARGLVLVAGEDALVARAVEAGLTQGGLASLFEVRRVTESEGRRLMAAGGASALVLLPANASRAMLDQAPLTITLVTNPAQRILPSIVQEALQILVDASFYAQRLFGAPLREIGAQSGRGEFPSSDEVAAVATAIAGSLRSIGPLVLPPVFDLQLPIAADQEDADSVLAFGRLFLPGLLFMSLLFVAQGMSDDLWEEQKEGTLRRALCAPPGALAFLLGKVIAGAIIVAGVALAGMGVAVALFEVPVLRAVAAVPWSVLGGTVLIALFFVPQVLASSPRGAHMLTSMLVFPLMMIGGSFFPFEAMPPWMAAVGRWTPNGQAVMQLKALLQGTASAAGLVVSALAMLAPAIVVLLWVSGRMQRRYESGA
jgi:ABC-type multidrug transport system permease subunit